MFPKVRIRILNASFNMQTILSVPGTGFWYLLVTKIDRLRYSSIGTFSEFGCFFNFRKKVRSWLQNYWQPIRDSSGVGISTSFSEVGISFSSRYKYPEVCARTFFALLAKSYI